MNALNIYCRLSILAVIFCVFISCQEPEANTQGEVKEILIQKSREFSQAYMNKQFEKIVDAYTEDGLVIARKTGFIQGHKKLAEYWTEADHSVIKHHKIYPVKIELLGDHAYDYGYYTIGGIYNSEEWGPSNGTYLIVWKKVNGDWKIHIDMFHEYEGQIPDSLLIQ